MPQESASITTQGSPFRSASGRRGGSPGDHGLADRKCHGDKGSLRKWFSRREDDGRNVVITDRGSGFATLRSLIDYIADHREDFRDATVAYGARTPQGPYFTSEYGSWHSAGIEVGITVDMIDTSWKGNMGSLPPSLPTLDPPPVLPPSAARR